MLLLFMLIVLPAAVEPAVFSITLIWLEVEPPVIVREL